MLSDQQRTRRSARRPCPTCSLRSTPGSLRSLPPQKNAVLVVELMLAASPEWFTGGGKPGRFANEALEWAYAKFGKENILTASLHRDEKPRICRFC